METTEQENDKFHHPIIDRITLVQLHPQVLKEATVIKTDCESEESWDIVFNGDSHTGYKSWLYITHTQTLASDRNMPGACNDETMTGAMK